MVLKKKSFEYFYVFYGLNLGPLVWSHLGPRDLCLNKKIKRSLDMQCYIPNLMHLSKVVLKKKFLKYFFYVFYGSNLGLLWRDHLGPCGLDLNKLGKKPLGNATYQISSI